MHAKARSLFPLIFCAACSAPTQGPPPTADMAVATAPPDGGTAPDLRPLPPDLAVALPGGTHVWSKSFGGLGAESVYAVATDRSGNVIVTGSYNMPFDLGGGMLPASAGGDDIFIAKFDSAGKHLWSHSYGGPGNDYVPALAVDATGNILVAGAIDKPADFGRGMLPRGAIVIKLSPAGETMWMRGYAAAPIVGTDVSFAGFFSAAFDALGNAYLTGVFEVQFDVGGGVLVSAGDTDIVLAKLDRAGAHVWSKRFGSALDDSSSQVAIDPDGNVVFTGGLGGPVDFGGGPLTPDIVTFSFQFLAKLNSAGAHMYSKLVMNQGAIWPSAHLGVAPDGSAVVSTHLPSPALFTAYDRDGSFLWSQQGHDSKVAIAACPEVVRDLANNVLAVVICTTRDLSIGGKTVSCVDTSPVYVVKLDRRGGYLWHRVVPSDFNPFTRLATDGGFLYVTTTFTGTIDLGGGPLTSAGKTDVYLLKLAL